MFSSGSESAPFRWRPAQPPAEAGSTVIQPQRPQAPPPLAPVTERQPLVPLRGFGKRNASGMFAAYLPPPPPALRAGQPVAGDASRPAMPPLFDFGDDELPVDDPTFMEEIARIERGHAQQVGAGDSGPQPPLRRRLAFEAKRAQAGNSSSLDPIPPAPPARQHGAGRSPFGRPQLPQAAAEASVAPAPCGPASGSSWDAAPATPGGPASGSSWEFAPATLFSLADPPPPTLPPPARARAPTAARGHAPTAAAGPLGEAGERGSDYSDLVESWLDEKLRPHQREGVRFLLKALVDGNSPLGAPSGTAGACFGAILADFMGLGKTLTSLATIHAMLRGGYLGGPRGHRRKALLLAPPSLLGQWSGEITKFFGGRLPHALAVASQGGRKAIHALQDFKHSGKHLLLTSYDFAIRPEAMAELSSMSIELLVCDEGQRLKNHKAKTFTLLHALACKRRLVLTGTPLQNDLWEAEM